MTDARLPGRWVLDPTMLALSDRLWRIHTNALMWCAEQGTDGEIPVVMLRLLHPYGATATDASELIAAGLWAAGGGRFTLRDWGKTQSMAADVDRQRERNRAKSRAYRKRQVTGLVTGHAPGETPRQGEARQGKERQGQELDTGTAIDDVAGTASDAPQPVTSWATATPGNPGDWTSPDAPGSILDIESSDDTTVF